jgi:hypothetical protein
VLEVDNFNTGDMIKFLRTSIGLPDPESVIIDETQLSMTDEDLNLLLNIMLSREFSEYSSIDEVPVSAIYPIKLLAQKELCLSLAVKYAAFYDITADNNNQLKEGQMFDHFMKLADSFDKQYEDYLYNGGAEGFIINSSIRL